MLKFGFRNKNFYPLMLLLFIFLRIVLDKILKAHPYKDSINFITAFLIFSSQSLIGYFIYLFYSKRNYSSSINNNTINTTNTKRTISKDYISVKKKGSDESNPKNINIKVWCLIIFCSFFNFVGCIIRSDDVINFGRKEENNSLFEIRVRSIQIIISSLLCYYTIRLNIYRHQKLSLIIISFFLVLLIIIELYIADNIPNKLLALIIVTTSCLFRSFLDVTEKYLFDFEFIDILKMLIYEGLIGVVFYIIYFISNKSYQNEGKNIIIHMSNLDWDFVSFIVLIILYIIISGFRNAYRVTTNKYYSPMSRALFESTLDPLLFLYNTLTYDSKDEYKGYWLYFSVVLASLTIIAFFSLVYNDLIILYCCGLNLDTYAGITKRLYSEELTKVNSYIDHADTYPIDGDEDGFVVIELKSDYLLTIKK